MNPALNENEAISVNSVKKRSVNVFDYTTVWLHFIRI
jgi:hypothetical protein